ncbi:MAG: BamA/TamA family outer membrane protein [Planctomycetaceae bacterium]|nr:BamA/TamA family outer membrane protein [Planctomycetaceae bacterium]
MAELRTPMGRPVVHCVRHLLLAAMIGGAASWASAQMRPEPAGVMPPGAAPAPQAPAPVAGDQRVPPGSEPIVPGPAASDAGSPQEMVVDVKFVGAKTLPLSKILPHVKTRAGRPFDLELIQEDVRRLDKTGMFVDIKTYWQQVNGGRVVIFDLAERPLLHEVLFVGCQEIRKKVLQKEAGIKAGDAANPYAVEQARSELEEFYHKRGFSSARVTILEGNKPEDRRVVFLFNEGIKQRVLSTRFVGNTIVSEDRLRQQIGTSRPFLWLFGGELDRKKVDEDVEKLTAYYRGMGFFRARINRELQFNEKQNWVTITFVIDEGPQYMVRNVSVIGNTKYTADELMSGLKLKGGYYFNQGKMTADQNMLQDMYGGIGYVFADVKADPRFLEEPAQLDLVYSIKEGERYRVGKINVVIKGDYPHTQLTTVLNRLSLKPGDILDTREVRASQRRLRASGLFEANPANGNAPKIVFNPPGQESADDERLAKRPSDKAGRSDRGGPMRGVGRGGPGSDGEPTFRGQSPESDDRVMDLTLDCGQYIGPKGPGASENRGNGLQGSGQTPAVAGASDSAGNDALWQAALAYSAAAARAAQQRPQPRDGLIETQYSPDGGRSNPASQPEAQWLPAGSSTRPQQQPTQQPAQGTASGPSLGQSSYPAAQSGAAGQTPQAAPVQPNPAYGQQYAPSQAPQRPIQSPEGQYLPGPVFSENSPFRDGSPDGGSTPPALPLSVFTEEAMTGRLMFGVGINSDAGLVGSIVLDEQNFDWTRFPTSWEEIRNNTAWRGAGERLRIEAVPGTQLQRYMVDFQEPYLFNTAVSMGLSGYYYNRQYTEYLEQRVGGRVSLGYQFAPDLSGNIAYRGAKINITDPIDPFLPDLADVAHRDLALHGFSASLSHDKRDNAFLATEGHLVQASFEQVLGSFTYPHAELDLRKYFTLYERPDGSGRHVLTLSARAGATGGNTPIYERYYAGGFSTIRGFQFRDASPHVYSLYAGRDVFVGGDFELFASAEYMFPITADDMIRGVVFCDTGTVEPTINNWSDKYRVAPGFGLRICVPAMGPAPIALDFAFPVSWQQGDRFEVFSFFVGFGR